ncbi:C6 zinc finger domain-containing protein [Dothidotthia symphoricarpi CBS 119687]|uniref:C6 zinc finger domain-containing protein n=1 Tax=Dothidotthia symphoricarpi CBS 119687 TaxID=1392245 RepID=A0A6A5ZZC0_9PLEO|nr:C6 zinc finger domain-containing protein [Dothidotthia symphoricarpi CBS 119687]KAF2124244.1 C6 zinc finger domain-containing protein [Dothidotthia symphoricarpi CBS 119687]
MPPFSRPLDAAPLNHAQSEAKRRRLRKGTHSCWECKRRKMKCIFDAPTDANICHGCKRRGSQCISQEFPEEASANARTRVETPSTNSDGSIHDRRRPTTPIEYSATAGHCISTPVSIISEPPRYLAFHEYTEHHTVNNGALPTSQDKFEKLSRFLYGSLPSREDIRRICSASRHPAVLAHEVMTTPYSTLHKKGLATPETLLDIPEPSAHPVLIARYMLLLATLLQHLHPDYHEGVKTLSESPRAIMDRLADLATSLVTTNDELLGSIEGLECVIIESGYQANIGNLRRSWVSSRRAMNIAQLMGLDIPNNQAQYKVLDPKTKHDPRHMWFRIVYLDRYLCLMLGVSQGSTDRSMAIDAMLANDTEMGRLERMHCVIASEILERNKAYPNLRDTVLTRALDVELQKAASSLPSKWWLVPEFKMSSTEPQAMFWNTRRLFAQVQHYNLLNQLHLPYMLCSKSAERSYEYSRITCVSASREILSRFITLRRYNGIAWSCRAIDFLALMAAMTLLLAHLDSRLSEAENVLAHQYHSDRAMIEQVQENMEEVNRLSADALSAKSADLLRRLLAIETKTSDCRSPCATRVSVQGAGTETVLPDRSDDAVVKVHIPYFGIIKIAREGMTLDVPRPQATSTTTNYPSQPQGVNASTSVSLETLHSRPQMHSSELAGPSVVPNPETITPLNASYGHIEAPPMMSARNHAHVETLPTLDTGADDANTHFTAQPQYSLCDPLPQPGEYPELAAGTDDWAFQGVDLAFFESLIRSSRNEGTGGTNWNVI